MIVLGHNIGGAKIEMDFVNIGILKAVGMTNASVKLALLAGYMCTVASWTVCWNTTGHSDTKNYK